MGRIADGNYVDVVARGDTELSCPAMFGGLRIHYDQALQDRGESMPDDAPPLTWTLTPQQVEFIWKETREVFGNKLWFESMLYADLGLSGEWQNELERRVR